MGKTGNGGRMEETGHAAEKSDGLKMKEDQPIVYVCLLSAYTVASAQAIQKIRPRRVIAVSSKVVKQNGNEDRFLSLVHSWGVECEVLGSGSESFPAESVADSRKWFENHLVPRLKKARDEGCSLFANITGSTKAAAISLKECIDWDEIHYTAEGKRNYVEVLGKQNDELPPLDLLEEARLLNSNIDKAKNPFEQTDSGKLLEACQWIYNDYEGGIENSILHKQRDVLKELWFGNGKKNTTVYSKAGVCIEDRQIINRMIQRPISLFDVLTVKCGCSNARSNRRRPLVLTA